MSAVDGCRSGMSATTGLPVPLNEQLAWWGRPAAAATTEFSSMKHTHNEGVVDCLLVPKQ